MQLFPRHHPPSIRSKLVTLVLACALPILLGYFAFARDADRRERAHIAQDAQTVAQALGAAIERDLASGEAAARVLANSRSLASGDLAEFHARARRLLRPDFPAFAFELSGPDGAPLLDTRYPFGAQLRPDGNEADVRRVFASGDAATTGLHRADPGQPYTVSIDVPVWRDGRVAYALSVQLRPRRMADLLGEQNLPPHWFAEVYDSEGRLVARSIDQAGAAGARMQPNLAAALGHADRGVAAMAPFEGAAYESAFSRSPARRWTVSVAYPRDAARRMLGHSQAGILLGAAALLAVTLGLAWRIGGSIARSVRALTVPAAALGRGEPLAFPPLPLREAAAVADALLQVEDELVGYRTGLETLVAERTAELVRSNALLEAVYASAPVGLCFMDSELRFVMINDYLAALNGVPAAAHLGRTLPEVLGTAGAGIERSYRRVLETGRPLIDVEASTDVPGRPGEMCHWLSSYYPVFGPGREVAGINAVVLDITERKLQEQRNRDNEEMFRALFEGSRDANMLVAAGAGFVSANRAAATLFGCATIEQFLTLSPASASPAYQPGGQRSDELAAAHIRRALDSGGAQFEWLHRRLDGSTFHADVVLTSVDIGGKGIVQALVRDISARVATEEALKRTGQQLELALREAEQASRAKGQFLANMSHEIRTPMNAIMGLARLLEDAPLGQRERGYASRMKIAARSLLAMLNDVLDFSRTDSGQLALEHTPFRLAEVLDSIAVLAAANAWDKGIEPVFALAPDLPARLAGDPTRLGQVLLNLVGNAIKFTDQGEVVLSIRVLARAPGSVRLRFAVRDTGIGIAPEQQQRMFEAFSQGDSSTSRKYGGAGLGLAISRRLVELMGGELRVHSALGQGAEFWFDASFEAPGDDAAAPQPPAGLAVLVADDNASACAALAESCAAFGWQVARAHGGREALALLRAGRYDLAFIDSAMPGLDGAAVLARARATGTLPLSALMVADSDPAPGAVHAGIALLAKPVTPARLRAALAALLGGPAEADPGTLPARLHGLRVLLVEDNQINQEVARHILAHAGAAVDIAANGRAALDLLAAGARYDVVLMDLQMPVMNGFEASAAIRAMGLERLPIVAMTANAMDEDRRRALDAGMDAHLAKPVEVDELLALLERIAGRAMGGGAPAAAHAQAPDAPQIPGIDLRAALARFGGDFGAFATLLRGLEESEGGTPAAVRERLARGDATAARQLVHRLRGVAANLGATEVASVAFELEQALGASGGTGVDALLAQLDGALRHVLQGARGLPPPAADAGGAHATPAARGDLVRLLELLMANNMGALEQFEALGPSLAARLAPQQAAALGVAVRALRFDEAAALLRGLLEQEEDA